MVGSGCVGWAVFCSSLHEVAGFTAPGEEEVVGLGARADSLHSLIRY